MTHLMSLVSLRSFCRAAVVVGWLISADPASGQAPSEQLQPDMQCEIEVRDSLARWETTGEMFRDASGPFGDRNWRLPTRRVGT